LEEEVVTDIRGKNVIIEFEQEEAKGLYGESVF